VTEFGESDTSGYKWHFRDKRLRWNDVNDVIPPYQKGDILWVRETFTQDPNGEYIYCADPIFDDCGKGDISWTWTSPIFMPREAARITLEIKAVKIERVQDITDKDVRAEGWPEFYIWRGQRMEYVGPYCDSCSYSVQEHKVCSPDFCHSPSYYSAFWNKLNTKRGCSWESNPYVYVYEFMRVT
jgi:hypothetical protein